MSYYEQLQWQISTRSGVARVQKTSKAVVFLITVVALNAMGCASYQTVMTHPGSFQKLLVLAGTEKEACKTVTSGVAEGMRLRGAVVITPKALTETQRHAGNTMEMLRTQKVDGIIIAEPTADRWVLHVVRVNENRVVAQYATARFSKDDRAAAVKMGDQLARAMSADLLLDWKYYDEGYGARVASGLANAAANSRRSTNMASDGSLNVTPNAYGLGTNADQYGRPHVYRLQGGAPLPAIFQDDVRRNAYGLGVHSDQFGRPVYDSRP